MAGEERLLEHVLTRLAVLGCRLTGPGPEKERGAPACSLKQLLSLPPSVQPMQTEAPAAQQTGSGLLKGLLTAAIVAVAAGAAVALGGKKAAPAPAPAQQRQAAKAWGRK